MSWDSWEKSAEKGPYSIGMRIFFFVLFFVVLIAVVGVIAKPFITADKITDPDRMIYTYEWFHKKAESAKAATDQIKIKQDQMDQFKEDAGDRKDWTFEDKQQYNRISTELAGIKAHRASIVREYNAHSNMITRDFAKGKSLPDQLE